MKYFPFGQWTISELLFSLSVEFSEMLNTKFQKIDLEISETPWTPNLSSGNPYFWNMHLMQFTQFRLLSVLSTHEKVDLQSLCNILCLPTLIISAWPRESRLATSVPNLN